MIGWSAKGSEVIAWQQRIAEVLWWGGGEPFREEIRAQVSANPRAATLFKELSG